MNALKTFKTHRPFLQNGQKSDHNHDSESQSEYETYENYQNSSKSTFLPEMEDTIDRPTQRSGAMFKSFFPPQPYNPQPNDNSPFLPPNYILTNPDIVTLPETGRRRAISRNSYTCSRIFMMPTNSTLGGTTVASAVQPFPLNLQGTTPFSSAMSRDERPSVASSAHNLTHHKVLNIVRKDGAMEAKNPKKFVCEYSGCGEPFTRNSTKTYLHIFS